jgi:hypothetical protein
MSYSYGPQTYLWFLSLKESPLTVMNPQILKLSLLTISESLSLHSAHIAFCYDLHPEASIEVLRIPNFTPMTSKHFTGVSG